MLRREVGETLKYIWMQKKHVAILLFGQITLTKGLRPACFKVPESIAYRGMLRTSCLLPNVHSALSEGFGFRKPPLLSIERDQVEKSTGNTGMQGPERLLPNEQDALIEGFGFHFLQ